MSLVADPLVPDVAKVYRTLGDLRGELQGRLGQGATGSNAGVNRANLNSILRTAQKVLYTEFNWHTLIRYENVTLGQNATRLDYPSFMDPERLLQIGANVSAAGTSAPAGTDNWREVKLGITLTMYNTQQVPAYPQRYELYDQIEFWPKADRAYPVRIWGIKALPRFTEDEDRCLIDDDLVFLWALATAKAHYSQKDAVAVGNQVEKLRQTLRAKSWKKSVFEPALGGPGAGPDWEAIPKPVVVGR